MLTPLEDRAASHWADDLQNGTMQGLAALRLLLATGLNRNSEGTLKRSAEDALRQVDQEIAELRVLIAEMRDA